MNGKRIIFLLGICLLMLVPLSGADLDAVINQAKKQSSTIQLIELNKKNSDVALALKEVENTTGVAVEGSATFKEANYGTILAPDNRWSLIASPEVVITLPNDSGTKITIDTPISKTLQSDGYWSTGPAVGVSHTFKFGDSGDILNDLKTAQQRLEIDRGYRQRIYDFETSIYAKISEVISYEMSLLNIEKDLYVLQTKIDNALKLRTMSEDSIAFQNMELEMNRLKNLQAGTAQKMELAKSQFKQITGLEWQSIEKIRAADLSFKYLPMGDATVISAALDLEIAKEELALDQRKAVTSPAATVPSLTVGGNVGLSYAKSATESLNYSVNANATYFDKSFSVGTGVNLGITKTGKVTPSFTISGSWQNNATSARDALNMQVLEQDISIAEIAYQEAMLTYQMKANQLEADILSYKLEMEQFEQTVIYKTQVLEKALTAFKKGLLVQAEVDQAKLDVELTNYEGKRYALEALMLENRAKALQL